ncbi:MAG: hypothetical protein QF384_21500 [Alphaproteobacteria bacterium]|jgi:hypothetical protein|nr:hypothetical protein [Alphaproteobacteria bacterium]
MQAIVPRGTITILVIQQVWQEPYMAKVNKARPRILLVGLPGALPDADWDEFYTDRHFLDYDIVIVDPMGAINGQNHNYNNSIHDGVLKLEEEQGERFDKRYYKTIRKLFAFTGSGGCAIVFSRSMPVLKYQTFVRGGVADKYEASISHRKGPHN